MNKIIAVIQSGWVFVGDDHSTKSELRLHNASCIRKWGTTNGLGQIAISGPTPDTVLDPCGELTAPMGSVLFTIKCQK